MWSIKLFCGTAQSSPWKYARCQNKCMSDLEIDVYWRSHFVFSKPSNSSQVRFSIGMNSNRSSCLSAAFSSTGFDLSLVGGLWPISWWRLIDWLTGPLAWWWFLFPNEVWNTVSSLLLFINIQLSFFVRYLLINILNNASADFHLQILLIQWFGWSVVSTTRSLPGSNVTTSRAPSHLNKIFRSASHHRMSVVAWYIILTAKIHRSSHLTLSMLFVVRFDLFPRRSHSPHSQVPVSLIYFATSSVSCICSRSLGAFHVNEFLMSNFIVQISGLKKRTCFTCWNCKIENKVSTVVFEYPGHFTCNNVPFYLLMSTIWVPLQVHRNTNNRLWIYSQMKQLP